MVSSHSKRVLQLDELVRVQLPAVEQRSLERIQLGVGFVVNFSPVGTDDRDWIGSTHRHHRQTLDERWAIRVVRNSLIVRDRQSRLRQRNGMSGRRETRLVTPSARRRLRDRHDRVEVTRQCRSRAASNNCARS